MKKIQRRGTNPASGDVLSGCTAFMLAELVPDQLPRSACVRQNILCLTLSILCHTRKVNVILTKTKKTIIIYKIQKGVLYTMNDSEPKTIRFERELIEKINEMREGTERNFSQQVKWMLKQYIRIIEESKQ